MRDGYVATGPGVTHDSFQDGGDPAIVATRRAIRLILDHRTHRPVKALQRGEGYLAGRRVVDRGIGGHLAAVEVIAELLDGVAVKLVRLIVGHVPCCDGVRRVG